MRSADIRADIYSLGCTLYHLLCGHPPFPFDNLWDLYRAHHSIDAKPLNLVRSDVPVELAAAVAKMMAKDPESRFQTPAEVARALSGFFKRGRAADLASALDGTAPGAIAPGSPADGKSRAAFPTAADRGAFPADRGAFPADRGAFPADRGALSRAARALPSAPATEHGLSPPRPKPPSPAPRVVVEREPPEFAKPAKLLAQVVCPHCWERFQPADVLWISEHLDLLGDPRLGPERQQRFLPSRFTITGDAIDARGMTCQHLACPHCHLPIPRDARDGAIIHLDPGSAGQRQVLFLDDHDVGAAPALGERVQDRVYRCRPVIQPNAQRM